MEIRVRWRGLDRETLTSPGVRLSYLLTKENIDFPFPCGGEGLCGRCKVKFLKNPPPPTPAERRLLSPFELGEGVRLACCAVVEKSTEVELLGERTVVPDDFLLDLASLVSPGHPPREGVCCCALDLGTTTLALSRLDVCQGARISVEVMANPQRVWGSDVVSRMGASLEGKEEDMVRVLWDLLLPKLEGTSYLVVAGNAVMETILAGYPVDSLARYPFESSFPGGEWKEEPVPHYFMPLVGKFLGGDAAALLLVLDLMGADRPALALDLGTNAEVLLLTHRGVRAASAPAGPAFEGVGITSGIGLSPGAVTRVEKGNGTLVFHTLNGGSPRGFCGSGLLSLVALLLREGVLEPTGRIKEREELSPFWREMRNEEGLILEGGLTLTQEDVRKVQLAKAAVASAWRVLLSMEEVLEGELTLYMAGTFGSSLPLEDLVILGLVPSQVKGLVPLGNVSLLGAEVVALSRSCLERVEELVGDVEVMDLAIWDGYQETYLESLHFPG